MHTNPSMLQNLSTVCKPKFALVAALGACVLAAGGAAGSKTLFIPPPESDDTSVSGGNPFEWGSANNPGKISFVTPGDGKTSGGSGDPTVIIGGSEWIATKTGGAGTGVVGMGHVHLSLDSSNTTTTSALILPPPSAPFEPAPASIPTTQLGTAWIAEGPGLEYSGGDGRPGPVPTPGAIVLIGAAAAMSGRRRR